MRPVLAYGQGFRQMAETKSEANKFGESVGKAAEKTAEATKSGLGKLQELGSDGVAKVKESGYFDNFSEFNGELVRPFKQALLHMPFTQSKAAHCHTLFAARFLKLPGLLAVEELTLTKVKDEVVATLKLQPKEPEHGFNIWNVLSFYFGVLESLLGLAFGLGLLSLLWNLLLGYFIAYTLFWGMLCKKTKKIMFWSMVLLVTYVVLCAVEVVLSFTLISSLIMYLLKLLSALLMAINGYVLYKNHTSMPLLDP
eukprot:6186831-Pleurochrysis_carterae.AAC.1